VPTYDYECEKCGHEFELFQYMSDEHIKKCPECGGKVRRLIGTGSGIIFKGSGFYATDYRSDSYNKSAKAESSSLSVKGTSKDKKKEKPEKKETAKKS
jgi:putative FmdB family regulatory protein